MEKISRDEIKVRGIGRVLKSFKYSLEGLKYAYKYEQSMSIHVVFTVIAIVIGFVLKINLVDWAIIFIALGTILGMELINTSIEAMVDLVTLEKNQLAKIAKDCGSAATFVLSLVAAVACLIVYAPHFIEFFNL